VFPTLLAALILPLEVPTEAGDVGKRGQPQCRGKNRHAVCIAQSNCAFQVWPPVLFSVHTNACSRSSSLRLRQASESSLCEWPSWVDQSISGLRRPKKTPDRTRHCHVLLKVNKPKGIPLEANVKLSKEADLMERPGAYAEVLGKRLYLLTCI
jgi:hypothetical protein